MFTEKLPLRQIYFQMLNETKTNNNCLIETNTSIKFNEHDTPMNSLNGFGPVESMRFTNSMTEWSVNFWNRSSTKTIYGFFSGWLND